jgi:4-amino-4-deoxy-L-arabinose transferase-like glycosyltransferase
MNFDFSPQNAGDFVRLLTPLLSILATYLVTQTQWKSWVKAGVAFVAALVIAGLTAYSEGALVENFWANFTTIFTAAQVIYWTVFKALGFERFVKPVEAVAGQAADKANEQVANLPTSQVTAAANPATPEDVVVETKVVV